MPLSAKEEVDWHAVMRERVTEYLKRSGVAHGAVGEVPAWQVFPVISLWAIESGKTPGWISWWMIAGDCPIDYVSRNGDSTPRSAIEEIWVRWGEAAKALARGEQHPNFSVGNAEASTELAPLLAARSKTLRQYATDDGLWNLANLKRG
jgi:hypothetical protein